MRASPLCALLSLALSIGCVGVIDDAPAGPGGSSRMQPPVKLGALPSPSMRRLTREQYMNSVTDLLGEGVAPSGDLDSDNILNGFAALGASRATISPIGAELYEQAAFEVAEQAMSDPARRTLLVPCTPAGSVDAACARMFVTQLGRRAWRRPLEAEEIDTYSAIAVRSAEVLEDFYEGLEFAIAALLQSPNFLFRVEIGEDSPEGRRFTSLEMASRLSFALWNSMPDDALLDAAERGDLASEEGVRREAERMLALPRSRMAVRTFFSELLRLEALDRLPQDRTLYPQMTNTIGAAMRESTLKTIEHHLLEAELPYRSLFDSRTMFVNSELAALYELRDPEETGFVEIELPEDGPRAGLLGHASLLAALSHSHASSPTLRGKFVRESLLCQTIPPPPPEVGEIPEPSPGLPTMRERLAIHRENPVCASCHAMTDPIGLGLENFDAIGAFRTLENNVVIDASGELDGEVFADARELGGALRDHPELMRCLVRNLFRFTSGHVETKTEAPMLDALASAYDVGSLRDLVVELVTSDGFRHAGPVE